MQYHVYYRSKHGSFSRGVEKFSKKIKPIMLNSFVRTIQIYKSRCNSTCLE